MYKFFRVSRLVCLTLLLLLTLLDATLANGTNSCTLLIPPGGAYDIVRTSSSEELHELLDDYIYQKDYKSHDEALKDGFSLQAIVYGVPLKAGATFDQKQKDEWKHEYQARKKLQIDQKKRTQFEQLTLNVPAMQAITKCIAETEGYGVIASLDPASDCTASFSALYHPIRDSERPPKVSTPPLTIQGGSCDKWPKSVVSFARTVVNCRRNERDALIVTINTRDGPGATASVPAMLNLGSEPTAHDEYGETLTAASAQDITLFHANFTFDGHDLGGYRSEQYHDLVAPQDQIIQSVELVSCTGCTAHFWLCPDGGICPHQLFEKLSDTTWRVYTFQDSNDPPIQLAVKVHYLGKEHKCIANCGADVIRANWLAEKSRSCPAVKASQALTYSKMFNLAEPTTGIPVWISLGLLIIIISIAVGVLATKRKRT